MNSQNRYSFIKSAVARLAQSVARETLNLKVVGSSPTSGFVFLFSRYFDLRTIPFGLVVVEISNFFPGGVGRVKCGQEALVA